MRLPLIVSLILFTHLAQSNIAVLDDPCIGVGHENYGGVPYSNKTLASRILRSYFSFDNETDRKAYFSVTGEMASLILDYEAKGFGEEAIKEVLEKYNDDIANLPKRVRWQDRDKYKEYWLKQKDTSHGFGSNQEFVDSLNGPKRPMSQCTLFLYIYDEIKLEDVKKLEDILADFSNPPFIHVSLNSSGGSVQAGIELGRIVREHYGIVNVNSDNLATAVQALKTADANATRSQTKCESCRSLALHYKKEKEKAERTKGQLNDERGKCYSACVLIYAGGISRLATFTADIGVHQHFFKEDHLKTLTVEEGIKNLRKTTETLSDYFDELGVNPELLQVALSVNKDKMRILDLCELQVLLPFAVSEYANVIPEKYEEQFYFQDNLTTRYIYESLGKSNNTLTEILNYSYASLEREKPNIKWTAFYNYGLRDGIHQQKQDWAEINCGNR